MSSPTNAQWSSRLMKKRSHLRRHSTRARAWKFGLALALVGALSLAAAVPAVAQEGDGKQDESQQRRGTAQGFLPPTETPEIKISSDLEAQIRNTPYGTVYGQNKVTYQNFDFWVYKGPHFDIYYYLREREAALDAARMAERSYNRLSRILGHEFEERKPIILYASHS